MKRVLIGLAIGAGVLVLAIVIAVRVFLDPEVLGPLAVERAEDALGREVELGGVSLVFFSPALDLERLRIGGAAPADPDFATIEAVRLRMSIGPLLTGNVAISALEITAPRIRLDVDADGVPVAPVFGEPDPAPSARPQGAGASGAAPTDPSDTAAEEQGAGPAISLTAERVVIVDGEISAGDLRVVDVDVSGRVVLDGTTQLAISLEGPGVGRVPRIDLTIERVLSDDRVLVATGELTELDLARVAALAKLAPDPVTKLDGRAEGTFRVELAGGDLRAGEVSLAVSALALVLDEITASGSLRLEAALGGALRADLTQAEIAQSGVFAKPAGDRLVISGELPASLPPKTLALRLGVPGSEVPVRVDLDSGVATLAQAELDLAPLSPWLSALPEKNTLGGKIRIPGELRVGGDPLAVRGALVLDALALEREGGPLVLAGTVKGEGGRVSTQDLVVRIGGETVAFRGGYDLRAEALDVSIEIADAKVEPMLVALAGKADVTGSLSGKIDLRGAPDLAKLEGSGQLDITNGQVRGFSILEQATGELAAVARTVAASRGKDLSRYDEEAFERMGVRFMLAGGRAELRPVVLEYRYGRAELRGPMRLLDRTLDLTGDITLTPEVSSEVIGKETEQPLVLSGCGVRGPIDDPEVACDRKAMAAVIARVGLQRKLGDRLEEKLGPDGKKAVEGLLEGILGGGKKR